MTAEDSAALSALFDSPWANAMRQAAPSAPWESGTLGAVVEQRALSASLAVTRALWQHAAIPMSETDEVDAAFEEITYERTIRVETDLVWRLGK